MYALRQVDRYIDRHTYRQTEKWIYINNLVRQKHSKPARYNTGRPKTDRPIDKYLEICINKFI